MCFIEIRVVLSQKRFRNRRVFSPRLSPTIHSGVIADTIKGCGEDLCETEILPSRVEIPRIQSI